MPRPLSPTGVVPEYLRECPRRTVGGPPVLRWRTRPPSHFAGANGTRRSDNRKTSKQNFVGAVIESSSRGAVRVPLRG